MSATTPTTIAHETARDRQQATKKPFRLLGMEPVTDIESYDAVPWFRKTWSALGPLFVQSLLVASLTVSDVYEQAWFVGFPLFALVLAVTALTGGVYAKGRSKAMKAYSDAEVWRYTAGSRVYFVVVALSVTVTYLVTAIVG